MEKEKQNKCSCSFCDQELKNSCMEPEFCEPCDVKSIPADKTLDCTGYFCPMPLVKTKLELDSMKQGQMLEVSADDPGFEKDLRAWCDVTGQELVSINKEGKVIKAYIRKKV